MAAIDVSAEDWDAKVLKSVVPVVVDFWAPWCSWCRRLAPDFDALSGEYAGKLVFAKVNVAEALTLAARYGTLGLPPLKLFCAGRPLGEVVGYLPRNALRAQLDRMLSMYEECRPTALRLAGKAQAGDYRRPRRRSWPTSFSPRA